MGLLGHADDAPLHGFFFAAPSVYHRRPFDEDDGVMSFSLSQGTPRARFLFSFSTLNVCVDERSDGKSEIV